MRQSHFWLLIMCIVWIYSAWYWTQDHHDIASDYLSDQRYLYHSTTFVENFFTPATKRFGNLFLIVLGLASLGIYWSKRNQKDDKISIKFFSLTPQRTLLAVGCILFWAWTQAKIPPSTDEIFSTYVIGSQSFWKIISYYPLPNHHVLFNLVNKSLSFIIHDPIVSGRILSCICYVLSAILLHRILAFWVHHQWTNVFLTFAIVTQFLPLGFGAQARGYSMYLMLGLMLFYYSYLYITTHHSKHIFSYILSCALGCWCIPSFLYLWFGIGLAVFLFNSINKKLDSDFVFANVKALILTAIFYMPIVTISSWSSLLDNKYVAISGQSPVAFVTSLLEQRYFVGLWDDIYGVGEWTWLGYILCILPLSLLFSKSKNYRNFSILYSCILFGLIVMVVGMAKTPFYRNLIFHSMLMWIGLAVILDYLMLRSKNGTRLTSLIALVVIVFTFLNMGRRLPFHLYYYDIRALTNCPDYEFVQQPQSSMAIHSSAFYQYPCMIDNFAKTRLTDSTNVTENLLLIANEAIDSTMLENWQVLTETRTTKLLSRK
jgi:hypothetical protein